MSAAPLRAVLAVAALAVASLATSCTIGGAPASESPDTGDAAPTAPAGGPAVTEDEFSPLIVTTVAGELVPVRGTDGLTHVVYELEVLNASPRPATITSIVWSDGDEEIGGLVDDEVVGRTIAIGDYPFPPQPAREIPAGTTAVLLMDATFASRDDVPAEIDHTISASFGDVRDGQANYAELFPTRAVEEFAAPVSTSAEPVVVGPPLTGSDWVAVNACCSLSPHRGAMIPIGGRINAAERYAVDWSRFDLTRPLVEDGAQWTFSGDPTDNADYFTYDQPVLAVGDGEIVAVVDDLPDAEPRRLQDGLPLSDYGGNHVVLKLADGVYAFYAHLRPGSVSIAVGDRVTRGDEIARTGNSGNTTESHLHFHVMDGVAPLTATNLPFEIDAFEMLGTGTDAGDFLPDRGERTNELPLILSAIAFPE